MPKRQLSSAFPLAVLLAIGCAAAVQTGDPKPAEPPIAITGEASAARVVTAATVTAARAPTASAQATAVSQRDAVTVQVGDRALEIAFQPGPIGFVSSIKAGEAAVTIPRLKSKGTDGRGDDLVLIDHVARDGRAYALFAAITHGSPECGSYGFWALRLDAKGVRVTPMIEGCFLSVGGGHPKITWSNPAMLVVESPQYQSGASIEVFTLDEASFVFRSRVQAKVPD